MLAIRVNCNRMIDRSGRCLLSIDILIVMVVLNFSAYRRPRDDDLLCDRLEMEVKPFPFRVKIVASDIEYVLSADVFFT
jgi:hypothetical protein